MNNAAKLHRGIELFQTGQYAEAERCLRKVLRRSPKAPDALHILGLLAAHKGNSAEAEQLLKRCIAIDPNNSTAHNNLGNILLGRGQLAEAEACYRLAVRLAPQAPLPHYSLGNGLRAQGRLAEAEYAYRIALQLAPDHVAARINLGGVLREQRLYKEAELVYSDLLVRHPNLHEARLNLGNVYRLLGELDQARTQYEALLQIAPGHARAHLSLALLWLSEHDLVRAAESIENAQRCTDAPAHEVLAALSTLYIRQGNRQAALDALAKALDAGADSPEYYIRIAGLYSETRRYNQAIDTLHRSRLRFGDRSGELIGLLVDNQRRLCDWRNLPQPMSILRERLRGSAEPVISTFTAMCLPELTPADLLCIARAEGQRLRGWMRRGPLHSDARNGRPDGRLRIGYLSGDLREHPVAYLTASVYELHDRRQFEVFAYDIGPAGDSPMRQRMRNAFEHFVELRELNHEDAAQHIRDDGIDILVDMHGYTRFARTEILAQRPAPIQASWLGFPGSMGVPFIDYLIADRVVVPPAAASYYDESLAYLPSCYMPVDFRRAVGPIPGRAEAGLPEEAVVFCCFNNPYKITPEIFACWCDILDACPDSVLWLYANVDEVREHLLREATDRGLTPERLVFAAPRSQVDHLARIALADLFLDTQPYNAHTTASDALWVGVPVLTYPGETFPSRVASSLLTAAGLPESIATDPADYKNRAIRLASDPTALRMLKKRLVAARASAPLFDTRGFAAALEGLYREMWSRYRAGLPPAQLG